MTFADPTRRVIALRGVPLFGGLRKQTLLEIDRRAEERIEPAGVTVVTQGDEGDSLYVILKGRVDIVVDGQKVNELGSGDFFGEMALIDREPRSASVVTAETTSMLRVLQRDFDELLNIPQVARIVIEHLSERLRQATRRLLP